MGVGSVSRMRYMLQSNGAVDGDIETLFSIEMMESVHASVNPITLSESGIGFRPGSLISSPVQLDKQRLADLNQYPAVPEQTSKFNLVSVQPIANQLHTGLTFPTEEDASITVDDAWPLKAHSSATSPLLPPNNNPSTSRAKSLDKSHLNPYQFDESVLQTINEWQRRNAAFSAVHSEDDLTDTPASSLEQISNASVGSSQKPTVNARKTLLSLSRRDTTEEKELIDIPVSTKQTDTLASMLAKSIIRDRSKPTSNAGSPQHTSKENSSTDAQSCKSANDQPLSKPAATHPLESANADPYLDRSTSPPWAAAFASISASRVSNSKIGSTSTRISLANSNMGLRSTRKYFGEKFGLYQGSDSFISN